MSLVSAGADERCITSRRARANAVAATMHDRHLLLVLLLRCAAGVLEGVRPATPKPKTLHLKTPRTPSVLAPMPDTRPSWFKAKAPGGPGSRYAELRKSIDAGKLNTVCDEAACPNAGECWEGGTATIMLLGEACTRGCRFCNVKTDTKPPPPSADEPLEAALAVASWGVDYIVLTSVDRDDLEDGGAGHFAKTVGLLKELQPSILVECLVSDFAGAYEPCTTLATCGLDVYAHNVETVERLQKRVRDPRANYAQSLMQLRRAKAASVDAPSPILTKTSLMLGLGETRDELRRTMADLRANGVDVVTFGQYLRPTEKHLSVVEYVHPDVFDELRDEAVNEFGFEYCASGPMVRSSYKAGEFYLQNLLEKKRREPEVDMEFG